MTLALLISAATTARAHEDPAGCFETAQASVVVSAFRADGTTGVVGPMSECETINFRARLAKSADISTICAFSGGTFTLTTPDGTVHDIDLNVPCIGGDGLGEGCDPTRDFLDSVLIPYTLDLADVVAGFVTATANYVGGMAHDSPGNTPGVAESSFKKVPVVLCGDNDNCTIDNCDPASPGSSACQQIPIVCDDNNACTTEACNPATGQCVNTSVTQCNDNNLCTTEACNVVTGQCDTTNTLMCDDNDACTADGCNPASGQCIFILDPFPSCAQCGNGVIEEGLGEQCEPPSNTPTSCCDRTCHFSSASTICRDAVGSCDAAENCTGSSAACPTDELRPLLDGCESDNNPCTIDVCDGSHVQCMHTPGNAGTTCRPAAGICDAIETCTGNDPTCPPDDVMPIHSTCPSDNNVCTTDECNGVSVACQHVSNTVLCRAKDPGNPCDVAETCSFGECPPDGFAPAATDCPDEGIACTTDACNTSGECTHTPKPRLTVCEENGVCDGLICRHLPANCTVINPPVIDPGEQCDDGASNETPTSCCRFDCTFQPIGTACTSIPGGRCNNVGQCVTPGECGNGIPNEVSVIDGQATLEECDLGPRNVDARDQGACCSKKCGVLGENFVCRVPATTCQQNSTCGDASRQLPTIGECPVPLNGPNDASCFANCQLGKCADGTCTGQSVCSVDVVRKGGNSAVPKFAVRCGVDKSASGAPNCTVNQVSTSLRALLSPFGVSLMDGTAGSALVAGEPATNVPKCEALADPVRAQCSADVDGPAFFCAQQRLVANRKPKQCDPTPCYQALVALGKGCKKALEKKANKTLDVDLVAEITGIAFGDLNQKQELRERRRCARNKRCN